MKSPRLISRIAIFSALVYVLSWATAFMPNVNLIFFIVFTAGFLWGATAGMLTGLVGMGLWTNLNPYGPALPPIMVVQCFGAAMSGLVGAGYRYLWSRESHSKGRTTTIIVLLSVVCTTLYFVPVSAVDAWLFQPFWPRFVTGLAWSITSLVSNALIFPLLFSVTLQLYRRECAH